MKFKVFAKKDDGTAVYHYYDNLSLEIYNEEGIPVDLYTDPRCKNLKDRIRGNKQADCIPKRKEDIRNIRITLGYNCNFHCKYCLEHAAYGNERRKTVPIHEDVEARAQRICKQVLDNFPNLKDVVFWGGEPFVYFKTMKRIVEILKEVKPDLRFGTLSNGSLLNRKIADWMLENNVDLTISHDGHSFHVYRDDVDPLDNPTSRDAIIYLIQEFKKKGYRVPFNIVVTPENADLQKIIPFFEEKLGFTPEIQFESIVKLDRRTSEIITPFTEETSKILLNNLFAYGTTATNEHAYRGVRNLVSYAMQHIVNRHLPTGGCMIRDYNFAAVNMNGEVLLCHGDAKTYCKIEDIEKVPFPDVNVWGKRQACKDCPVLVTCLGACPCISLHDQEIQCKNLKLWASGIFVAAWKVLFDATIYRIEPCSEEEWNDHIIG